MSNKMINKKIIFKVIISLLLVLSSFVYKVDNIMAASLGVYINNRNPNVGDTISVTISANNMYVANLNVSCSGGTITQAAPTDLDNGTATIQIRVTSSTSVTVTASGLAADYDNPVEDFNVTASDSVSVATSTPPPSGGGSTGGGTNTPSGGGSSGGNTNTNTNTNTPETPETPKSTNNSLSGLSISAGTLSPEFNADTTDYVVTLPADATSINVSATAQDEKATINGTGDHSLKVGLNEIVVNVVAENGEGKNYHIKVSVDETPLVFTNYNNQKLGVVRNLDEIGIPSNFEETTVQLDGQEVKAWHSNSLNKTIVFLVNEAGEKNFYIYENGKVTSVFKSIGLLGKNLYIVDIPEEMKTMTGLKFGQIEIDGNKLSGWTFEDSKFANYMLIYMMDEQGNMKFYQYEKTENTLQLYSGAAAASQEDYDKTVNDAKSKTGTQQIIIYVLAATTVVAGGVAGYAIYQLMQGKKNGGNGGYKKKFDYEMDNNPPKDNEE